MESISFRPDGNTVLPQYDSYCLSNIPTTILSLFGINLERPRLPRAAFGDVEFDSLDKVVLLVLDGLGYREWRNQSGEGFIGAISRRGHVRPITTVFPSTTAAALTSLSTALTPQEHCLPEWFVYFREIDMILATLPFTPIGDSGRDTLVSTTDPKMLFSGEPIYKKMKKDGIRVLSFMNRQIAKSAYTSTSLRGSVILPYISSSDLVANLKRQLQDSKARSFFYVYWSYIDTVEHRYGPNTDESALEASTISFALKKALLERLDHETAKSTLIIVTSDHGQINVLPEETLYLNRYRKLVESFERGQRGNAILPSGGARDVFLHIDEGKLDDVYFHLSKVLHGKATVLRTEEAIETRLFGINKPARRFRDRVGNLLVLPHGKDTIWYHHKGSGSFDLLGHHGGLSEEEMVIPFAVARLSDLQVG